MVTNELHKPLRLPETFSLQGSNRAYDQHLPSNCLNRQICCKWLDNPPVCLRCNNAEILLEIWRLYKSLQVKEEMKGAHTPSGSYNDLWDWGCTQTCITRENTFSPTHTWVPQHTQARMMDDTIVKT